MALHMVGESLRIYISKR